MCSQLGKIFKKSIQVASDEISGVNYICGSYDDKSVMPGYDKVSLSECRFGKTSLKLTKSSPSSISFEKNYKLGKITMSFKLNTVSEETETIPFTISNLSVDLVIAGESELFFDKRVDVMGFFGTFYCKLDLSLKEFFIIKEKLSEFNSVLLKWSACIHWYDVSDPAVLKKIKDNGWKPDGYGEEYIEGSLYLSIDRDGREGFAYEGVKSLLAWEKESVRSDGDYSVWYKDTMSSNTYYFLPQIYRIKSCPKTGKPQVEIILVDKERSIGKVNPKVVLSFNIGPYFHPKAMRDLYDIIRRRSHGKEKYCSLSFGGFESAKFVWDKNFEAEFGSGVKALVEDNIETNPDSSFRISIESDLDFIRYLNNRICGNGITIGQVILTVNDGINNNKRHIPIEVNLDFKKLTNPRIVVETFTDDKKVTFPYKAKITNEGDYTLLIGGYGLSVLSYKKGIVRDAVHDLCLKNSRPVLLNKGESYVLELSQNQVKELLKKNNFLGINFRKYWSEMILEPYSVKLIEEDVKRMLFGAEDLVSDEIDIWKLDIATNISWEKYPSLNQIHVEVASDFISRIIIPLEKECNSETITMVKKLSSIMATQKKEERKFSYRVRVVLEDKVTKWAEKIDVVEFVPSIYITKNIIDNLILKI